jgi:hypothetical protein
MNMDKLFETEWFKELFEVNAGLVFDIDDISSTAVENPPTDEPIVVIQRPYTQETRDILSKWRAKGVRFYVLHISDEYGQDPIDFYVWEECKGVLRNYVRPDVTESEKVKVIPLGYHWAANEKEKDMPKPTERELTWSFVGTGWQGRREKLEILKKIPFEQGKQKLILQDNWDSKEKLGREEMLQLYLN